MINVTPNAIARIKQTVAEHDPSGGLRLGVQGGGCSGFSYLVKYSGAPRANDNIFEFEGARVFIDPKSLKLLDGLTLDYQESLIQSGFVFQNPNATKTCSCGTSFDA